MKEFKASDSVLLIRSANIGDFLVCVPFVNHLHYVIGIPWSRIGIVIFNNFNQDPFRYVFGSMACPEENKIVVPATGLGIARNFFRLRELSRRFSRLCYLPFQTESPRNIFRKELALKLAFGLNRDVEGLRNFESESIRNSQYYSLFDLYGLQETSARELDHLNLSKEEWAPVCNYLRDFKDKVKIAVYPNSKLVMKVWPMTKYIELIAKLLKEYDCIIILIGAAEDQKYNKQLADSLGDSRVSDVAGQFSIRQSIAFLSCLELIVGNDGAPLHMAALANIPIVGLYTHKAALGMWAPAASQCYVTLEGNASCGPCLRDRCDNPFCLLEIPVDLVGEWCKAMLGGRRERKSILLDRDGATSRGYGVGPEKALLAAKGGGSGFGHPGAI